MPLTTQLGAQMRRPQAALLDPGLQRWDQLTSYRIVDVENMGNDEFEWLDLVTEKLIGPVEICLVLRVGFEVPHGSNPLIRPHRAGPLAQVHQTRCLVGE